MRTYALRGAWYLIPFSLLWGGFAIFWEISALSGRGGLFFALWGLPFVAVGLYMIFGRLIVARREAQNTWYGLTDQRVLIMRGASNRSFVEIDLRDLPGAQFDEAPNGLGTITFGTVSGLFRPPPGWPTLGSYVRVPAFEAIPDVRRVYALMQDAKAEARGR